MLVKDMLLTAAFAALTAASPTFVRRQSDLDSFVTVERARALQGAIDNIGGSASSLVPDASPGMVVAAPSTTNPNYYYSWTRDSALTFTMLVDELILGNTSLQYLIEDYIEAQTILQNVTNPSGSLYPAGLGLGEPKFYTNETAFEGDWGRPQRDGPALRAIALINYCKYLLGQGSNETVKSDIWPIIQNDLKYVGQYWNQTGFDLWEEIEGSSFFTINNQHRALTQGSLLAGEIGEACDACGQAPEILCFLSNSFWNETGGYLTADINVYNSQRSGINADQILGCIHVFDIDAPCDAADFQPCNSKSLATLKVVVDSFRDIYPINSGVPVGEAVAIGRYPEDVFFGGNPWFLCTLAVAEFLYDAAAQIDKAGSLAIDSTNLAFFQDIFPEAATETYSGDDLAAILGNMTTYADGFVSIVEARYPPSGLPSVTDREQTHKPANGSLSEQFSKTTGEITSAWDLTWSFASFVTMAQRRSGQYPSSWGYQYAVPSSETCSATSFNSTGTYAPVTIVGGTKNDMD